VQVSAFSSKFDAFVKRQIHHDASRDGGLNLFKGKANCNSCHVDGRGTTLSQIKSIRAQRRGENPPLFTCFGSANEGVRLTRGLPSTIRPKPDASKFIANPLGFAYRDLGMGTFLERVRRRS